MTDEQKKICLRAIDHFGVEHQKEKAVEELLELGTEIMHDLDGRAGTDAIHEELADVIIMCEQLRIIYGAANVDGWIDKKLQRLVTRIDDMIREEARLWKNLYKGTGGQDDA